MMNFSKKLFVGAVLAMTAVVPAVQAQTVNNDVLVKVNNIKPNKDGKGNIESCNFDVVIFNRTPNKIQSAKLVLSWDDAAIDKIIKQESDKENVNSEVATVNRRTIRTSASKVQDVAKLSVESDVSAIEPDKQISISSKLSNDRCFLLMGNASVSAKDCNIQSGTAEAAAATVPNRNVATRSACPSIEFVSSKDPRYYRDFKEVSNESQNNTIKSAEQKIMDEIEADITNINQAIEKASAVLKDSE